MNSDVYHDRVPADPPAVYLHVGPPKTGTTYLQDVLWLNQARLAERGVNVPGKQVDHFHAALDLRGIQFGGHDDPAVPGAWARLATRARAASGKVVISHEVLAGAQPEQIAEAVSSLAPARVHVVYGARDLGRQLPAVWQEGLKNRQTRGWGPFLKRSLLDDAAVDRGFWRSQHAVDVLARWAAHVPADRITVVTLPPADAVSTGGDVLWDRFCQALEIDGSGLDLDVARTNASLSAAQCEVLRMLNQALPDDLELAGVRAHREATVQRRRQRRTVGAKDQDPSPAPRRGVRPGRAADRGAGIGRLPGGRRPRRPPAARDGVRPGHGETR